jgi:hypothetical protein
MEKKFNWGWKVAILYGGFVVMMVGLVGMSIRQKIDLVSDDYYARELVHQEKIDKIKRANALEEPVRIAVTESLVEVTFPKNFAGSEITGTMTFYCPSDDSKDRSFAIEATAGVVQRIPKSSIQPGRYHLQVDWSADQLSYWNESILNIQR